MDPYDLLNSDELYEDDDEEHDRIQQTYGAPTAEQQTEDDDEDEEDGEYEEDGEREEEDGEDGVDDEDEQMMDV